MTLFQIDKSNDDRSTPVVNSSDVHLNRMAHATDSIAPRAAGSPVSGKITTKNDQIVASDGTVNRIIFGRLPNGVYGIAISKPGVDVGSAF
jgi:hypothetical protein